MQALESERLVMGIKRNHSKHVGVVLHVHLCIISKQPILALLFCIGMPLPYGKHGTWRTMCFLLLGI